MKVGSACGDYGGIKKDDLSARENACRSLLRASEILKQGYRIKAGLLVLSLFVNSEMPHK